MAEIVLAVQPRYWVFLKSRGLCRSGSVLVSGSGFTADVSPRELVSIWLDSNAWLAVILFHSLWALALRLFWFYLARRGSLEPVEEPGIRAVWREGS